MYEEENLKPAEKALESALGQLKPVTNTLNRDEFMFNAGRASAGSKRSWQILSGFLTILLLVSILIGPGTYRTGTSSQDDKQSNYQIAQTAIRSAEVESQNSMEYPKLRENIIRFGLDALEKQQTTSNSEPARNQQQWLDNMLSS